MKPGDRVKLSERGLRAFTKSGGAPKRKTLDWRKREGTVSAIRRCDGHASVVWDGCKAPDTALPPAVFEIIPKGGDSV
jgi:hypothetical protein